jgi:hypothetical protein
VRSDAVGRRRHAGAWLSAGLLLAGCAARPAAPVPAATPAVARDTAENGPWLTDEQGRRYTVRAIPRSAAVRIDERTVRSLLSVPLDVVREDDVHYYYKVYRAPEPTGPPPPMSAPARTATLAPPAQSRLDFVPFGAGLPTSGQWRDGFALADMNGDGHLDVVHGPARKGRREPSVFLGDGAGSWRRWQEARFPPLPYDYGAAEAGDLNGDGRPDLALAVHLRGIIALRSDGRGGFADAGHGLDLAANGAAVRFSSRALAFADVDGDGRRDIVALADGPRMGRSAGVQPSQTTGVAVYLNGGDAPWRREPTTVARGLFGNSLVMADFDGDGRQDLASASSAVGRRDVVSLRDADGAWRAVTVPLPADARVRAVAAGDVDGDGRAELALAWAAHAGGWQSGVELLRHDGDGWSRRPLVVVDGLAGPSALAMGDVSGDGRVDVVALTTGGETWVLAADGDRFVRDAGPPAFGPGCRGSHVEVADVDADGRAEIVAAFAHEPSPGPESAACPTGGGLVAWKAVPRPS